MSESREEDGILGKYVEHRDDNYDKTGESRVEKDVFGDKYVEHRDDNYDKTGESREKEDIFGDKYTETTDANGNVIRESREEKDIFGDKYIKHTEIPAHDEDPSEQSTWERVTEKAAAIGAVLGAGVGLIEAFGSANGLSGYLWYMGGGAVMGAILLSISIAILPYAIGLGVLVLVLKVFGVM